MLTTPELRDTFSQYVNRETVRDGERYVVIKTVLVNYSYVFDDAYVATANVTDDGNVRFTHDGETVEYTINQYGEFCPVGSNDYWLRAMRVTPETLKMRDEAAHIVAATRLRQQAAELMAGLHAWTTKGEIDRVLALRDVVNELAAHEASINQTFAPEAPSMLRPLVEIPKQRVPEN